MASRSFTDRLNALKQAFRWTLESSKKLSLAILALSLISGFLAIILPYFFKLLIDHELKEKRKKYPQILKNIIGPFCGKAEDIEKNLEKELGGDDPVSRRFSFIVTQLLSLSHEMEENIKEGSAVDLP